jgi:hypothetical protein
MGVDYLIHYDCEPKRALTIEGLMGRLKGRDRAKAIIDLYRTKGDQRSPKHMGFEMVRRTADGSEETEIIVVQDLLDAADELIPYEAFCADCPANRARKPFGCTGTLNYPISAQAERWLLKQLPDQQSPLVFILLQKMVREMGYSGAAALPIRAQEGVIFELGDTIERSMDGYQLSNDQVFEMLFLSGPIQPAHGTLLLQFFGGISPDLDADVMMQLAVPPSQEWIDDHTPFLHTFGPGDDVSIKAFKEFFHAIYVAYRLGVPLLLDV